MAASEFTIVTKPVILSYPSLFKTRPKHPKTPNVLTYQASIILPPSYDLTPLRQLMELTRSKCERKGVMAPARRIKETMAAAGNPIHKAEEKIQVDDKGVQSLPKGMEPGGHYITLHRNADFGRPTLVDEMVKPVIDEAKFYAGCWCIFHLDCFPWENDKKWGLSFSFNGVQFVKDGPRLGGRPDVTSQFAPIAGDLPPAGAASDQNSLFDQ